MSRSGAIERAKKFYDNDSFFHLLADWVAVDTSSREDDRRPAMITYLEGRIVRYLVPMGFDCRIVENPIEPCAPFLIAHRIEDTSLPTILMYGHGDTVPTMKGEWKDELAPLQLNAKGDKWYGRGTADNKGQHAINLAALGCVIQERERLGYNVTVLIEMGEEVGSPGLHQICEIEKHSLRADVFIASDGPRINPETVTVFGGSRGVFDCNLTVSLREDGHHSGNWGGLLANPGILLAHAISLLVDAKGKILVDGLRPGPLPASIQNEIDKLTVAETESPEIDPLWGEPGLSSAHKVYGWNTFEVLAFECGNPRQPVNAIPPSAWARCHIRYTADSDPDTFVPAIRECLDSHGLSIVNIEKLDNNYGRATRMAPDNPFVKFVISSLEATLKKNVAFLPNLGGTLPNDAFSHVIGVPTIWIPHSYGGCNQHAPNEHLRGTIARQGLQLMAGLFWDLSEWERIRH